MKTEKVKLPLCALALLLLILDSRTSLRGAAEGVALCLGTVIPSLFPFFVISAWLTPAISGRSFPLLKSLGRMTGIPSGEESLLLVGFLSGYPVGAERVADAARRGRIRREDAARMIVFCNNPGPSFLFGITGGLFPRGWMVWALWGIQIISSLIYGTLTAEPLSRQSICSSPERSGSSSIFPALRAMAGVCGWVIVFRVVLAFLDRWVFWLFPPFLSTALSGVLELTNGCCGLGEIPEVGSRFLLCSGMLAFGGLCVAMQTASVTACVPFSRYLPGKLLQTGISISLALCLQPLLPDSLPGALPLGVLLLSGCVLVIFAKKQKFSRFSVHAGV